jgi:hypothetical protein
VARPPIAAAASGPPERDVERRPADPVRGRAVDGAGEEDENGNDREAVVDQLLVEEPPGGGREKHPGHPGQENQQEHGLLPCLRLLVGLVPERGEDGPRAQENGERPEPPLALRAGFVRPPRLGVH